jgi:hypothetical protein
LKDELPDLARRFDERTQWIGQTEHGPIEARFRDGAFELLTTSDPTGSRRTSTENARAGLEKRLRRHNVDEADVEAALTLFDTAKHGEPFEIIGQTYVHGVGPAEFNLPFDGAPVSDALPSLIAFHFLALALDEQVYDPRLDELRDAIRNGEAGSGWHVAEGGIERKYEPVHLVGFAQNEPHVVVRVQLFGWNVWRVHFPRSPSKAEPFGLRFDLKTKTIDTARPRLSAPLALPG